MPKPQDSCSQNTKEIIKKFIPKAILHCKLKKGEIIEIKRDNPTRIITRLSLSNGEIREM